MAESTASLIRQVPVAFREAIDQFAIVRNQHDRCESRIIDTRTLATFDQCAVDFRHVAHGISMLTEGTATGWCTPFLRFFQMMQQGRHDGNVTRPVQLYCAQAEEISQAFHLIAQRLRDIAGCFHHADQLVQQEANRRLNAVRQEEENARVCKDRKDRAHDRAAAEAREKKDVADGWGTALAITAIIPVVNLVTATGYAITNSNARDAKKAEEEALEEYYRARRELDKARSRHEEAKELHTQICTLTQKVNSVERQCEVIAAFMAEKANTFGSKKSDSLVDFIELGLESAVADGEVEWLSNTKSDLEQCHRLMEGITASSAYPSSARPQRLQIELPKLGITLQ